LEEGNGGWNRVPLTTRNGLAGNQLEPDHRRKRQKKIRPPEPTSAADEGRLSIQYR